MTIIDALDAHASSGPDRPFLRVLKEGTDRAISFGELRREALRYGAFFNSLGLPKGAVVFIVLQHGADLYFSFLGAMYAGLIPSFLPFPTPKQDVELYWSSHRTLFHRVEPGAILTYDANRDALVGACSGLGTRILLNRAVSAFEPLTEFAAPAPEDVALLQHSSGTTGLKKGVMLTFAQIDLQACSYGRRLSFTPDDVVVSWLPLYHDMGLLSSFLIPLTLGGMVVSLDAFEWVGKPKLFLDAIETYGGTLAWMPNFAFAHQARLKPVGTLPDLGSMRAFISCSEPCKAETMEAFVAAFEGAGVRPESVQACYAMAETVFAVSQSKLGAVQRVTAIAGEAYERNGGIEPTDHDAAGARLFASNGTPIDGIEVGLRQDGGVMFWREDATSDRAGEIVVRGPFVFERYYKNEESTRDAIRDGWYGTGDIGFFESGEVFICGRTKELLIVHGRNYYATDIESIVNGVDGIKPGRVVAFALYDSRTQSEEAIVVVESEMDEALWTGLKRSVKAAVFDRLELTLQSVKVVRPGWLVKTTSGKISRKDNVGRYQAQLA